MPEDHKETQEQNKSSYSINLKMVPLILLYQLWVVAIIQAFGWAPALPACIVTAGWLSGTPKGFFYNLAFVFVFAIVLPLFIIVALGLEAAPVAT
jgi:hypothetical protein